MARRSLSSIAVVAVLAGCGSPAQVVAPPPGDLALMQRPTSPNTYVAGPAGFALGPDMITRPVAASPERLLDLARTAMLERPRTTQLADDPVRHRADFTERSRLFGFPDVVLVQAVPEPGGRSSLVVYSRSLKGWYDFGVNGRRVRAVVAAVDELLARGTAP